MEPEESAPVRRLLQYCVDTAGGLMTPEPVVLTPGRDGRRGAGPHPQPGPHARAGQHGVRLPRRRTATPTGRYLGCVHTQRLLREPPFELVAGVLDTDLARCRRTPSLTEVTRYFAAYNLVCGPVVDDEDHLLGAVTVDDVLDHLLPDNWRDRTTRGWTSRMPELPARAPARPAAQRAGRFRFDVDPEAFGRFSERLARFLGTGTFLVLQTLLVIVWITLNLFAVALRWDPYPFILLNLAFSTQAAYAAPLILLAQNRQDDRDRVSLEEDRARAAQTKADTEYLARELAALRIAVGEVATRDYLRGELERCSAERKRPARGRRRGRRAVAVTAHGSSAPEPVAACGRTPPARRGRARSREVPRHARRGACATPLRSRSRPCAVSTRHHAAAVAVGTVRARPGRPSPAGRRAGSRRSATAAPRRPARSSAAGAAAPRRAGPARRRPRATGAARRAVRPPGSG